MAGDLLLVIDMQNVYGPGGKWHCPGILEAAGRITHLIGERRGALDVIFTRFLAPMKPAGVWKQYNRENEDVNEDVFSNELLEQLRELPGDYPVYVKDAYSSMSIPEVREAAGRADRVLVAGVVAECCVLATAMSLIDAGIPLIYLTDAVSGTDRASEEAVERILAGLEPLHVQRMTTEQYLMISGEQDNRKKGRETAGNACVFRGGQIV